MGVMLPPKLAPMSKPKSNNDGLILSLSEREIATGSIAAKKGTLSTNAERKTEINTIDV